MVAASITEFEPFGINGKRFLASKCGKPVTINIESMIKKKITKAA